MLKRLDNLSSPITLFYKGFPRHSSIISGIITILTYTTIIILGVFFQLIFFLKKIQAYFIIIDLFMILDFFLLIIQEFFILYI
jgi:hypothetical protein